MPTYSVLLALGVSWTVSGLLLAGCLWLIPQLTRKPIRAASHGAILKLSSLMMVAGPAFCFSVTSLAPVQQPVSDEYAQQSPTETEIRVVSGDTPSRQ